MEDFDSVSSPALPRPRGGRAGLEGCSKAGTRFAAPRPRGAVPSGGRGTHCPRCRLPAPPSPASPCRARQRAEPRTRAWCRSDPCLTSDLENDTWPARNPILVSECVRAYARLIKCAIRIYLPHFFPSKNVCRSLPFSPHK